MFFFVLFYKNSKKNVFIQVPFEVSFYSPIQTKIPEVVEVKEEIKPVEEPKPIEEIKPKEEIKPEIKKKKKKKVVKKDDIVVKKKEKVKKEEPKEEQPVENKVVEEKQQSVENSGSIISSNKGINLSGDINPSSGWIHLTKASADASLYLSPKIDILGW